MKLYRECYTYIDICESETEKDPIRDILRNIGNEGIWPSRQSADISTKLTEALAAYHARVITQDDRRKDLNINIPVN